MTQHQKLSFMTPEDRRSADGGCNPRAMFGLIVKEVCEYTGHSVQAVMGPSRAAEDCRVRELSCYIAHRSGMTLQQIGRALRRDHTSISRAISNEKARRGEE